jgi:hypothetical protein
MNGAVVHWRQQGHSIFADEAEKVTAQFSIDLGPDFRYPKILLASKN